MIKASQLDAFSFPIRLRALGMRIHNIAKEAIMKFASMFRAAIAVSLAGLLAACGGGGSAPPPEGAAPLPEVPWASPAVFVTPGQGNKSFALKGCYRSMEVYDPQLEETVYTEQELYKASLQIASNGDVSVLASTTSTGTVSVVWSIAFADTQNTTWSVYGTTQTPSYFLSMYKGGRSGNQNFSVYPSQISPTETVSYLEIDSYDNSTRTELDIECQMTDKLALLVNADQARAAKNLGSAAGVTTFDDYEMDGRIEGGKAFWQINDYGSAPQDKYNFMRFDLATGQLASSNQSTGTYATVSMALPSAATSYGVYGESITRGDGYFDYKDAKTICLASYDDAAETGFGISASAFGNKFLPSRFYGFFMFPNGFENPKGGGPGRCYAGGRG
jgi:hypothetical protein